MFSTWEELYNQLIQQVGPITPVPIPGVVSPLPSAPY